MGYYTHFQFDTETGDDVETLFISKRDDFIALFNGDEDHYEYILSAIDGQSLKWYDHEEDMLKISKLFPAVVFTITGSGEEAGDYWRTYYKDGKKQDSELIFSPFNENLLK